MKSHHLRPVIQRFIWICQTYFVSISFAQWRTREKCFSSSWDLISIHHSSQTNQSGEHQIYSLSSQNQTCSISTIFLREYISRACGSSSFHRSVWAFENCSFGFDEKNSAATLFAYVSRPFQTFQMAWAWDAVNFHRLTANHSSVHCSKLWIFISRIVEKLLWNNMEQVFDSSSLLLCLQIDEESCGRIEIKVSESEMPIRLIDDSELHSFLFEKVHWPFCIRLSFDSWWFSCSSPEVSLRFSVIDERLRPLSIWSDSSCDQVLCCFSSDTSVEELSEFLFTHLIDENMCRFHVEKLLIRWWNFCIFLHSFLNFLFSSSTFSSKLFSESFMCIVVCDKLSESFDCIDFIDIWSLLSRCDCRIIILIVFFFDSLKFIFEVIWTCFLHECLSIHLSKPCFPDWLSFCSCLVLLKISEWHECEKFSSRVLDDDISSLNVFLKSTERICNLVSICDFSWLLLKWECVSFIDKINVDLWFWIYQKHLVLVCDIIIWDSSILENNMLSIELESFLSNLSEIVCKLLRSSLREPPLIGFCLLSIISFFFFLP